MRPGEFLERVARLAHGRSCFVFSTRFSRHIVGASIVMSTRALGAQLAATSRAITRRACRGLRDGNAAWCECTLYCAGGAWVGKDTKTRHRKAEASARGRLGGVEPALTLTARGGRAGRRQRETTEEEEERVSNRAGDGDGGGGGDGQDEVGGSESGGGRFDPVSGNAGGPRSSRSTSLSSRSSNPEATQDLLVTSTQLARKRGLKFEARACGPH